MAEAVYANAIASTPNDLDGGNFTSKQTVLESDADTTPWIKVFQNFSLFIKDGTTYTMTVQLAFLTNKSDAFDLATQTEDERGAEYQFTGYAWARVVRTAATGTDPTVTFNYREN